MPGLRGTPGRDDDDVGVGALGVVAGAHHARVRSPHRARLEHVERDAGRLLIGDVDDDDIGQLLVRDPARDRGSDISRSTDDCNFAIHRSAPSRRRTQKTAEARTKQYSLSLRCLASSAFSPSSTCA